MYINKLICYLNTIHVLHNHIANLFKINAMINNVLQLAPKSLLHCTPT